MWWKSPSLYSFLIQAIRRVWRYQRGNQKPLIEIPKIDKQHEEGETTQWQKKRTQEQTVIYKTWHTKLKIEQHEPH